MAIDTTNPINSVAQVVTQALESAGVPSTAAAAIQTAIDNYASASCNNGGDGNSDTIGVNSGANTVSDLQNILTADAGNSTALGNDLQNWLQSDVGVPSTAAAQVTPLLTALAPLFSNLLGVSTGASAGVNGGGGVQLTGNAAQDFENIAAGSDPTMRQNDITNWLEQDLGLSPSIATQVAPLISSIAGALGGALGGSTGTGASHAGDGSGSGIGTNGGGGTQLTGNPLQDFESIAAESDPTMRQNDMANWLQQDLGVSPSVASELAPILSALAPALEGALGNSSGTSVSGTDGGGGGDDSGGLTSSGDNSGLTNSGNALTDFQTIAAESDPTMRQNDVDNWLQQDLGLSPSIASELAPLISTIAPALAGALGTSTGSSVDAGNAGAGSLNSGVAPAGTGSGFVPTGNALTDFQAFTTVDVGNGNTSSLTQDATTWAEQDLGLPSSVATIIAPVIAALAPILESALGGSSNTAS